MNRSQRLAIALTHLIYRNTAIEDYHSEGIIMDRNFYFWALDYYRERLKSILRKKNIIKAYKIGNYNDIYKLLNNYEENTKGYYMIYDIGFNMLNKYWDAPVEIEMKDSKETAYRYILKGAFLKHCNNHSKLDNKTMCEINKDICNRIYTLLLNGYFD